MGKRTAKVPLALISPNEPVVYGTRSKKQRTSIYSPYDGKENTPVRSSLRGIHNAGDELEISRRSNEKRAKSSDPSSLSLLRAYGKSSSEEHSASGSQVELAAMAVSTALVVPTILSSPEKSAEILCSGMERAPTKTYRTRRASREATSPLNPPKHKPSEDGFCNSEKLLASIACGATDELHNAYDNLFRKYRNLKKRQIAEAADAFDEQSKRTEAYSKAADDLVQSLRTQNSVWDQDEMINRSMAREAAYILCQNDLVMERARNLELQQHLESAESRRSKLLQELLEMMTQLTITNCGTSEIIFCHNQSGYEFRLEQNKLSEELGGKDALLYTVISPGTMLHVALEWMKKEIVFDKTQVMVFFQRIAAALSDGT